MVENAQKTFLNGYIITETVNMELYSPNGVASPVEKTMTGKKVSEIGTTKKENQTLVRITEVIGAIPTMITLVISAIILAEGVYGWMTGGAIFYSSLEPSFKFIFGFIVLTLISDKASNLPF